MQQKEVLFHQNNAPANLFRIILPKLNELHYELVYHPPYLADLAPSDLLLYPKMKKSLAEKRFASNEEKDPTFQTAWKGEEDWWFPEYIKI